MQRIVFLLMAAIGALAHPAPKGTLLIEFSVAYMLLTPCYMRTSANKWAGTCRVATFHPQCAVPSLHTAICADNCQLSNMTDADMKYKQCASPRGPLLDQRYI